ncbi:MAG: FKBP-type peptidyl-prolyl cis-trans isomerase, partial [Thalassolituus sp.]
MSLGIIETKSQVKLHFALKLADGQEVDSTFAAQPAELVIGDGNLPEGFEGFLLGLTTGD